MTSTPGSKIAGGIFGGIIGITILYIVKKRFDFDEAKDKSITQTISAYQPIPGQVLTNQPLAKTSIRRSNYKFDNTLINNILIDNLTLDQYISEQTELYHINPSKSIISTYTEYYTKHKAEANRIREEEKAKRKQAAEAAERNQKVKEKAKRNQEAKEAAERAAAEAKRMQMVPFEQNATNDGDDEFFNVPEIKVFNNNVMVPYEQNATNDGDDEFFNALPPLPPKNKNPITGSSKKSKKHKRRTRRRHKKN